MFENLRQRASNIFELSRGGAVNVRSMEGLRGLAVVLVFMVHYTTLIQAWIEPGSAATRVLTAVGRIGHSGVDLFFVLSGYLIYGTLINRPRPIGSFLARRVQRIYPTFLAVFGLYLVLSILVPSENKIHGPLGPALFYVLQNLLLLPGILPIPPIITVAWSLSYEMFFYFAIPLLIALLQLRRWPSPTRVWLFLGLGAVLVLACTAFGGPVRLIMFLSGMVLYEVQAERAARGPSAAAAVLAVAIAWAVGLAVGDDLMGHAVRAIALFPACLLLCWSCFSGSVLGHAFSWTPLRWLGNMSYSYYLIHGVSLLGFFRALEIIRNRVSGLPGLWIWLLPIGFLFTLLNSALLFILVERRFSLVGISSTRSSR